MLRDNWFGFFAGAWGCTWVVLAVGFILAIARARIAYVLLIAGGCLALCIAITLLIRREFSADLEGELRRRGYALTSLGMTGLSVALLAIGSVAVATGMVGLS